MDKRISDILNDLYVIDPQFKAHEQELRTLVSELILSKPDTPFDQSFASKLRAELLDTKVQPMRSPYTTFFVSRMFYGIVGSALTILIVVPLTFIATQKATSPDKPVVINPFSDQVKDISTVLTQQQQISNKGMNAFGKIALVPTGASSSTASTQTTAPTSFASAKMSSQPATTVSKITYTYKGDPMSLTETQGKVFKRTTGADSGKQLFDMVQNGKFGLTDLSSFSDLKLKNVQLSQDTPFGYIVGINLDAGEITVTPQKEYWNAGSSTADIGSTTPLTGAGLVSIADDFMKSHGIVTTVYDNPVGFTDSATVIYPLKIDNKIVLEEDGRPYGLVVTIDPAQKKVLNVSNLTSQTYDSSLYTLETNFATILNAATSSLAHQFPSSVSSTATLGTPKQVLMHYWLTDDTTGASNELYIPALLFSISYQAPREGEPSTIVVPLVKDFLAKQSAAPAKAH